MGSSKLKTEIVSTGVDAFIKETKEMKKSVEEVSKSTDKASKSLDNKTNAERRALVEARKHQQELKRASKEAKEFEKECSGLAKTLNNFSNKLGVNIGNLGSFATKLGAVGGALGVAGMAVNKFINSNDALGDSFTIVKNQITDVFDAMFRVNSNMNNLLKISKEASIAFDDMTTNVPLIEAQLSKVTFQYQEELALAQDINLEENERLGHLENAKKLLAEMNRLELLSLKYKKESAEKELKLAWHKAGGQGTLTESDKRMLDNGHWSGFNQSYLSSGKSRFDKLNSNYEYYMVNGQEQKRLKPMSADDKKFYDNYKKVKAYEELVNDDKLRQSLINSIDIEGQSDRANALIAEGNKTISRTEKRIKGGDKSSTTTTVDREAERQEAERKRRQERINDFNKQLFNLQSKKSNAEALGIDTFDIEKAIATLDEKMADFGIDGAGFYVEMFKMKLIDELKKINPELDFDKSLMVNDLVDLFNEVEKANKPTTYKDELSKIEKPDVDTSTTSGIEEAITAWKDYYNRRIELAKQFNEDYCSIEKEYNEKMLSLDDQLRESKLNNITSSIEAFGQVTSSMGQLFSTLADQEEEGSAKQKKLKKAQFSMQLASALANGVASAMSLPFPANLASAITTIASVSAMFASMPKFANGGVVGGSTTVGDKVVARLNKGEMVLNNSQQAKLFNMINRPTYGKYQGEEVTFRLKGSDIIGAINNYNNKHNK